MVNPVSIFLISILKPREAQCSIFSVQEHLVVTSRCLKISASPEMLMVFTVLKNAIFFFFNETYIRSVLFIIYRYIM